MNPMNSALWESQERQTLVKSASLLRKVLTHTFEKTAYVPARSTQPDWRQYAHQGAQAAANRAQRQQANTYRQMYRQQMLREQYNIENPGNTLPPGANLVGQWDANGTPIPGTIYSPAMRRQQTAQAQRLKAEPQTPRNVAYAINPTNISVVPNPLYPTDHLNVGLPDDVLKMISINSQSDGGPQGYIDDPSIPASDSPMYESGESEAQSAPMLEAPTEDDAYSSDLPPFTPPVGTASPSNPVPNTENNDDATNTTTNPPPTELPDLTSPSQGSAPNSETPSQTPVQPPASAGSSPATPSVGPTTTSPTSTSAPTTPTTAPSQTGSPLAPTTPPSATPGSQASYRSASKPSSTPSQGSSNMIAQNTGTNPLAQQVFHPGSSLNPSSSSPGRNGNTDTYRYLG